MWLFFFAGAATIWALLFYNYQKKQKRNISCNYSELISYLLQLDKKITIEKQNKDSIIFEITHQRGSLLLILTHFNTMLCVELERINAENVIDNQEWYFLEDEDQKEMFDKIIFDINATKSGVLKEKVLTKLLEESSDFSNIKNKNNKDAQSLFCMAYDGVKKFSGYKYINNEGRFEMLLFNGVFLINQISKRDQQQEVTKELMSLLIFYLEKHHSIHHIKDIEEFLNSRFSLYANYLDKIWLTDDFEYQGLYYLFRVKPLSIKEKKHKGIEDINFKNSIWIMIKELDAAANLNYKTRITKVDSLKRK